MTSHISFREMDANDLSLNDVVMPKCYTRVMLVFDYQIDELEKVWVEFLSRFCPTAFGQIIYDENKPNSGRIIESTMKSNQIFTRAELKDRPISYYFDCNFQEFDFFPYSALPTEASPLVFLHQIHVPDGTLLAYGAHHHFTDGYGFFTLIRRFSEWISHRDDSKIPPFLFDRSLLKPAEDARYEHIEYKTIPRQFTFTELPSMDVILKRYSKQELFDQLNITSSIVSFNDVLVAWLTQTISQIRQLPNNEIIKVGMANDGRSELNVGPNYFPNCNFYMCLQFPMEDLLNKSVNQLAEQVNAEKKKFMNEDYMRSAMAWVKKATSQVYPGFEAFLGKDLAFTNWSRFPAYQIDLGQGPLRRLSLPPARWDGLILILPTNTEQVELYIGLKEDHAKEFLRRLQ